MLKAMVKAEAVILPPLFFVKYASIFLSISLSRLITGIGGISEVVLISSRTTAWSSASGDDDIDSGLLRVALNPVKLSAISAARTTLYFSPLYAFTIKTTHSMTAMIPIIAE